MCAILQYTLCIVYSCGIILLLELYLVNVVNFANIIQELYHCIKALQQGQICEVVCTNKQGGTVIIESEVRGKMDYVLTILCCIAYL